MKIEELKQAVASAGVVGAGGAGFPLAFKLRDDLVDTLLINGAECEPLVYSDYYILKHCLDRVVQGAEAVMEATHIQKAYLAVKEHNARLLGLSQGQRIGKGVFVHELPNVYPVGDEVILTYEVLGRVVQPGSLPFTAGVIVSNVETMLNTANALENEPVTRKWVTISGKVPQKLQLCLPVGLRVGELFDRLGIIVPEDCVVIDGGPAMGKVISPEAAVITKTTKSLLVLPKLSPAVAGKIANLSTVLKKASSVCCQCSMCTDLCTRALLGYPIQPSRTVRSVAAYSAENPGDYLTAQLCSGCRVCELMACCQGISPASVMGAIKQELAANKMRYVQEGKEAAALPEREYRMIPSERFQERIGVREFDGMPKFEEDMDWTPIKLVFPLTQHVGRPAVPVVKPGDRVQKGDLLAKAAEGGPSAAVHASLGGVVERVDEKKIIVTEVS